MNKLSASISIAPGIIALSVFAVLVCLTIILNQKGGMLIERIINLIM